MIRRNSQSDSSVTVERLHGAYLVSREHPDPERLRWQLDDVMRNRLPSVCSRFLSQALHADDPSVWLIRRLEVDLALDVGALDDDLLAQAWGQQIAATIARIIARGPDGDMVLRFADQLNYLAQFADDLAEGAAWGKWYYHPFDSLRSLPTGAAIVEALAREPLQIEAVLLRLAGAGRIERVLSLLSEGDARILYQSCFTATGSSSSSGDGQRRVIEELLAAWSTVSLDLSSGSMASPRNALRLYLAVRARSPGTAADGARLAAIDLPEAHSTAGWGEVVADGALPPAIDRLLEFAEVLRQSPQPGTLLAHLVAHDLRGAIELARSNGRTAGLESLPYFQQVAAGDADWIARVARIVAPMPGAHDDIARIVAPAPEVHAGIARADAPESHAGITHESEGTTQSFVSPFGAIFLLLPSLLDLRLDELIEAVPYRTPESMDRPQALRYLLALKCLGRPRAHKAAFDPALHLAAGLGKPPSLEMLQILGESATATTDEACLRLMVASLARRGRVEGRCIAVELASAPDAAQEILLLRDIARDSWVYGAVVAGAAEELLAALDRGLTLVREATETQLECLLVGQGLGQCLDGDALASRTRQIVWVDADAVPQLSAEHALAAEKAETNSLPEELRTELARYLARAKPAAHDLAYLALPDLTPALGINAGFDLTWSLVARAVLQTLAGRLMGFDSSSAEYLYRNFLAGTSAVRVMDDQIDVQLPHSPLHIVLRIAGVDRQTYTVPWLNGAQVTLALPAG